MVMKKRSNIDLTWVKMCIIVNNITMDSPPKKAGFPRKIVLYKNSISFDFGCFLEFFFFLDSPIYLNGTNLAKIYPS